MSVTVVQGSSPLGTLGAIVGGLGTLTGNPLLSTLGTGMDAANSIANGNVNQGVMDTLGQILNGGWQNPAANNPANLNSNYDAWLKVAKQMYGGG